MWRSWFLRVLLLIAVLIGANFGGYAYAYLARSTAGNPFFGNQADTGGLFAPYWAYVTQLTSANLTDVALYGDDFARVLANARAPFVYAGGGVIGSGAQQELRRLQELAHLPVATSTMGKGGVDETHPLSLGIIGYYMGTRGMAKFVKPMVSDADVILLIGNRTNQNGTDSWTLLPAQARYIHIDIDPGEIGRNYESLRLNGDAKLTLQALNAALADLDLSRRVAARALIESTIATARLDPVSYTHLRAHETVLDLVCRLLLEKKKNNKQHVTY